MDRKEISERVKKALKAIKEKEYSKDELRILYNNVVDRDDINDDEKEILTYEVELKIRNSEPSLVKEIFGPKETKAREFLDPLFSDLFKEYDWSNNVDKSHVKACGHMINGSKYVCLYISYKNNLGISTAISYEQITPSENPFISVKLRQVRKGNIESKMIEEKLYPVESEEEAVKHFKKNLSDTINELSI